MPAALLAALAVSAALAPGEQVVEEIVAVVRNPPAAPPRLVTLTKLTEEARIALVSRGATGAATGALDPEALRAALDWLLGQMLVADEAARLEIAEVGREDVAAELRRFRERFGADAEYARFLAANDLTEDELEATLARTLRVQRYVVSRIGRSATVTDDEVDRFLRDRGAPAVGAAREEVRAQLADERARAQVKELLGELRARADVRILDPALREPARKGG